LLSFAITAGLAIGVDRPQSTVAQTFILLIEIKYVAPRLGATWHFAAACGSPELLLA